MTTRPASASCAQHRHHLPVQRGIQPRTSARRGSAATGLSGVPSPPTHVYADRPRVCRRACLAMRGQFKLPRAPAQRPAAPSSLVVSGGQPSSAAIVQCLVHGEPAAAPHRPAVPGRFDCATMHTHRECRGPRRTLGLLRRNPSPRRSVSPASTYPRPMVRSPRSAFRAAPRMPMLLQQGAPPWSIVRVAPWTCSPPVRGADSVLLRPTSVPAVKTRSRFPIVTTSPSRNDAASTRTPLTNVPLRVPASRISHISLRRHKHCVMT